MQRGRLKGKAFLKRELAEELREPNEKPGTKPMTEAERRWIANYEKRLLAGKDRSHRQWP